MCVYTQHILHGGSCYYYIVKERNWSIKDIIITLVLFEKKYRLLFFLVWFNDNLSKNTILRVNAMFLARYWTTSLWPAFCAHCAHCDKKMTLGLWSEKNWNVVLCLWKYGRWKKIEILLVDIMKCSLMDIVRIDCHLMRVNVLKFHLAVASFAACDITSVIHSELVFSEFDLEFFLIFFFLIFIFLF